MKRLILSIFFLTFLFACTPSQRGFTSTLTPFFPATNSSAQPSLEEPEIKVYIDQDLPVKLLDSLVLPEEVSKVSDTADADILLRFTKEGESFWLYVVVARFPTVQDSIAFDDLKDLWNGTVTSVGEITTIIICEDDLDILRQVLGETVSDSVQSVQQGLLETAWADAGAIAIIPFEELQMRWKVLSLNGMSPLYRDLNLAEYPLLIHFDWAGAEHNVSALINDPDFHISNNNWDPRKMTVLMLTGTSAFVRSVAERMETKGVLYPAEKIRDWLLEPDFTHISNEVAFTPACPEPDPWNVNLMFCSQLEYISLMEDIEIDIVEMTGNHLADYNYDPITFTLEQYAQRGWQVFGGGENEFSAREPLLIEHNGNQIALLGCNSAGPQWVWATSSNPGAAVCDFTWLASEIARLKEEGYIVFLTLQGDESYNIVPLDYMQVNFLKAADYGASVVSGSQAHFPQIFQFHNGTFIHFGLGNLFFDQMDYPVVGTRREFLDRYVMYDKKLVSVELKTAMLEDWAQPRPMSGSEREEFLSEIFASSIWQ